MVATVTINEKNSAAGTLTDKSSGTVRFKNADDAVVDANDPLVVPSVGSEWSFEKWLRLKIGATPPDVEISNLRFYTDGTSNFGTGVTLWVKAVAAFATPAEGTASTGYVDAFTYDSESPLEFGDGPFSSADTEIGDHLVFLMEIASTASNGALAGETMTFAYDEI